MPKLVIIGAGGFGREVLDVIEDINPQRLMGYVDPFEVVGFLDDGEPDPATLAPYGVEHLGAVALLDEMPPDVQYVIGIGSPKMRRELDGRYLGRRESPTLVHPSVTMGRAVTFGPGTVVCAGVRLTNNIRVGRHVHINLNATVGHDAVLEDYVTVSPLVAISGYAHLESGAMIGTGATLNPGITVGAGAVVGSGAAALKDIQSGVTAVGVPAKPR